MFLTYDTHIVPHFLLLYQREMQSEISGLYLVYISVTLQIQPLSNYISHQVPHHASLTAIPISAGHFYDSLVLSLVYEAQSPPAHTANANSYRWVK